MSSHYRFWATASSVVLSISLNTCQLGVSGATGTGDDNNNCSATKAYAACEQGVEGSYKECLKSGQTEEKCESKRESGDQGCEKNNHC